MLDQARARNEDAVREGRLELRLGSLEDLQGAEGSFDKACSVNVVQFLADPEAAFRKIFSILKQSGISATTYMPRGKNPSRENALNMAEKVKRYMEAAGFVKIRIEELLIEPAPAVCIIGEHP
jgi:ubiquinone/menaquinone biosynthesis C-methylase UbiE